MVIAQKALEYLEFSDLSQKEQELLNGARRMLDDPGPYNPYSGFSVGVAVMTQGRGDLILGANVENASFGASICGERCALLTAHSLGYGDQCVGIAIVTRGQEGLATTEIASSCGLCLQVMQEYAFRSGVGGSFLVLLATTDFSKILRCTLGDLYPVPFGPHNLVHSEPRAG
ncbi:cytidine deaminase [Patescibacteria group bacterium]|nr:cytidine deaminase [Patescibacteria group bacterium]